MTSAHYVITLPKTVNQKLKQKAERKGFRDIKDYIQDLLHHHAFHQGGRPRASSFDSITDKFAAHTKESRKRMLMIRRMDI